MASYFLAQKCGPKFGRLSDGRGQNLQGRTVRRSGTLAGACPSNIFSKNVLTFSSP